MRRVCPLLTQRALLQKLCDKIRSDLRKSVYVFGIRSSSDIMTTVRRNSNVVGGGLKPLGVSDHDAIHELICQIAVTVLHVVRRK
eukprot:IDg8690t1